MAKMAVKNKNGDNARSCVSNRSWLKMTQLEPMTMTVARYGRFRWT